MNDCSKVIFVPNKSTIELYWSCFIFPKNEKKLYGVLKFCSVNADTKMLMSRFTNGLYDLLHKSQCGTKVKRNDIFIQTRLY